MKTPDDVAHVMSIKEMSECFVGEWLLVGDPQTSETMDVLAGTVLHHSKDRDEVYRKAVALHPKRSAILFTGELPADTAIVL